MKSLSVYVSLVPVLVLVPGLWVLVLVPGLWAGVSGVPGCGPCDPGQCAALPTAGCAAGSLLDACGCCSVCAAAEGEPCGGRGGAVAWRGGAAAGHRAAGLRCGAGLECVRRDEDKKKNLGVCVCKSSYEVCGSDALTYSNGCALRSASLAAETQGRQPISIRNKGRCPTAPVIVSPPGEVYNVSGSQVYLSCEAVGVPTPVLTWKKVIGGKKREGLLPGDRDNMAIQTRGGPEKHEVTGWVLISPLTEEDEGSYECRAANANGEASAVGAIHLVQSPHGPVNTVTKEVEL